MCVSHADCHLPGRTISGRSPHCPTCKLKFDRNVNETRPVPRDGKGFALTKQPIYENETRWKDSRVRSSGVVLTPAAKTVDATSSGVCMTPGAEAPVERAETPKRSRVPYIGDLPERLFPAHDVRCKEDSVREPPGLVPMVATAGPPAVSPPPASTCGDDSDEEPPSVFRQMMVDGKDQVKAPDNPAESPWSNYTSAADRLTQADNIRNRDSSVVTPRDWSSSSRRGSKGSRKKDKDWKPLCRFWVRNGANGCNRGEWCKFRHEFPPDASSKDRSSSASWQKPASPKQDSRLPPSASAPTIECVGALKGQPWNTRDAAAVSVSVPRPPSPPARPVGEDGRRPKRPARPRSVSNHRMSRVAATTAATLVIGAANLPTVGGSSIYYALAILPMAGWFSVFCSKSAEVLEAVMDQGSNMTVAWMQVVQEEGETLTRTVLKLVTAIIVTVFCALLQLAYLRLWKTAHDNVAETNPQGNGTPFMIADNGQDGQDGAPMPTPSRPAGTVFGRVLTCIYPEVSFLKGADGGGCLRRIPNGSGACQILLDPDPNVITSLGETTINAPFRWAVRSQSQPRNPEGQIYTVTLDARATDRNLAHPDCDCAEPRFYFTCNCVGDRELKKTGTLNVCKHIGAVIYGVLCAWHPDPWCTSSWWKNDGKDLALLPGWVWKINRQTDTGEAIFFSSYALK